MHEKIWQVVTILSNIDVPASALCTNYFMEKCLLINCWFNRLRFNRSNFEIGSRQEGFAELVKGVENNAPDNTMYTNNAFGF